jgi:Ser/Thr protein kinase RdoA (MazF antagonist)
MSAGSQLSDPAGAEPAEAQSLLDVVEQVKTWNLSALFRIPAPDSTPGSTPGSAPVWLKLTPPFAAHEPEVTALIAAMDGTLVPTVLASDPVHRRALLAHAPGADCWDASPRLIRATVTRWVAAQAALVQHPIAATGVPERRPADLVAGLARLLDGDAGRQLAPADLAAARALLRRLPAMIDELDACGLPDTLVHGDFHPGNWRSDGTRTVLIDFADAFVGHPAFDGDRLRGFVESAAQKQAVADAWCDAWAGHVPGSDPARALDLARPLQALSGAMLYQMFLDHIEPSERRYHDGDPAAGIRAALRVCGPPGRR